MLDETAPPVFPLINAPKLFFLISSLIQNNEIHLELTNLLEAIICHINVIYVNFFFEFLASFHTVCRSSETAAYFLD